MFKLQDYKINQKIYESANTTEEKQDLARLNLKAGLRAKESTAYQSALEHFKTSILLFP